MKLLNIRGKERTVNINPYRIDWTKKYGSKFQFKVQRFFERYWKNHVVLCEFRIPGSLLRCDLLNLTNKIAIESHGLQHETFNKFFHGTPFNYLAALKRDVAKEEWYAMTGIQLIIIYENEVDLLSPEWIFEKFGLRL